jgi:hypothetical protein
MIGNAIAAVCFTFPCISLPAIPFTAYAETPGVEQPQDAHSPGEGFQRFKIVFEPDAYYADLDLIIALTRTPQMALSLAAGFVWESKRKYTGELAAGRGKDDFQFILRPNIEF